jgi:hypothetical protein
LDIANNYATQLAAFASLYTAHANIIIINAGVEMWSDGDRISFTPESNSYSPIQDFLPRFQSYLALTKKALFGTVYTVGVLISNKGYPLVAGGFTQGPPNTTWGKFFFKLIGEYYYSFLGASIINYRMYPWSIAGLLAHELAHTLSVVHPFELEYLCEDCPQLQFCPSHTSKPIPDECKCDSSVYPPEQCLMTFMFGRAQGAAPRYTSCDIKMMNFFSSGASCYRKVQFMREKKIINLFILFVLVTNSKEFDLLLFITIYYLRAWLFVDYYFIIGVHVFYSFVL